MRRLLRNTNLTSRASSFAVALTMLMVASANNALGQMQVQSGHALDASLEIGSSGYNYTNSGGQSLLGYTSYQGGFGQGYGRTYLATPGSAGAARLYTSSYNGGIQMDQRQTNYDTYINDKQYSAGWQRTGNSYSSYAGPPGGYTKSNNPGAYKINGKIGG